MDIQHDQTARAIKAAMILSMKVMRLVCSRNKEGAPLGVDTICSSMG